MTRSRLRLITIGYLILLVALILVPGASAQVAAQRANFPVTLGGAPLRGANL